MANDISTEIDIGFPLIVLWFGLLVGLVIGWNLCKKEVTHSPVLGNRIVMKFIDLTGCSAWEQK